AVVRVAADTRDGIGIDAAARRARYAALAARLEPGETLLTAHHADDQLETLLLRLVRGSGVRGLRGILPLARLGPGRVARPLLGFTRAELAAAAERWGLDWLEDPSNRSVDFDRNLIRPRAGGAGPGPGPVACRSRDSAGAASRGRCSASRARSSRPRRSAGGSTGSKTRRIAPAISIGT